MSWRRKRQPTPVFLPGKSHAWTEDPSRLQSLGSQRVKHDSETKNKNTRSHASFQPSPLPYAFLHCPFSAPLSPINCHLRDFSGAPAVRSPHAQCGAPESTPGRGTSSHTPQPGVFRPQLKGPPASEGPTCLS